MCTLKMWMDYKGTGKIMPNLVWWEPYDLEWYLYFHMIHPYAAGGYFCPLQNDANNLKSDWTPGTSESTQQELFNECKQ